MSYIKPEIYETATQHIEQHIIDSIANIKNEKPFYNTIVDIGSADGGLTKYLSANVPHKQLIGIDIDPEMIAYAKSQSIDDNTIVYIEQDMNVENWSQLCPQIRQLEGRVDLIFSNDTLSNIADRKQLMTNLWQLLSSDNGILHVNIPIIPDLNRKLAKSEQRDWYQSVSKQLDDWKSGLQENGFQIKEFRVFNINTIAKRHEIINFLPMMVQNVGTFFTDKRQFEDELDGHLTDTVFDAYTSQPDATPNPNAWKQFMADNTITEVTLIRQALKFICIKNI
ncbi:juvenile hormone acid O-methyltransferase-like [Oppia nitens]|uniref:juvenile hormone acid O-methyltransferase-like n=1 Tax=Oppia nitens TaxID=1686743 RepID=UPI0023DB502B|nr:juvenile hormone acid O-methyltransferase-like [Oppia nitens]